MSIFSIREQGGRINKIAPAGYYVGLRVGFYAPEYEINTFPSGLLDKYTVESIALIDPLRHWSLTTLGTLRWSELKDFGEHPVSRIYSEYGCYFGAIIAISGSADKAKRSVGYFSRSDRELTDLEINDLYKIILSAHLGNSEFSLTNAQTEALRLFANGLRHKQIAFELKISESAVKARLKSAIDRIGAKTTAQAASIASQKGLI